MTEDATENTAADAVADTVTDTVSLRPGNAPVPGSEDDWPSDLTNNPASDNNPISDGTDPKTRKARAGKVKGLRADAHGNGFQLTPPRHLDPYLPSQIQVRNPIPAHAPVRDQRRRDP